MTRLASLVVRLGLAALLGIAGALKLRAPSEFANEIANYQLMPALAPYLAAILPATELVVALGLVVAPLAWRRAAAAGTLALFGMFSVAVASAYFRRINIECGCFGSGGGPINALTLLRNAGLLAATVLLLRLDRPAAIEAAADRG